jgi:hypothetical protein
MNRVKKAILLLMFMLPLSNAFAVGHEISNAESKALVKRAVIYALENRDPNMDYGKYVSKSFINPIDGNTFNFTQWVTHQKNIKKMVKSMKPIFDTLVAENNQVAAIYRIKLVKNDGSKLVVKDLAFFKIKQNKIVYCEELTQLVKGNSKDKNIGSTK